MSCNLINQNVQPHVEQIQVEQIQVEQIQDTEDIAFTKIIN